MSGPKFAWEKAVDDGLPKSAHSSDGAIGYIPESIRSCDRKELHNSGENEPYSVSVAEDTEVVYVSYKETGRTRHENFVTGTHPTLDLDYHRTETALEKQDELRTLKDGVDNW